MKISNSTNLALVKMIGSNAISALTSNANYQHLASEVPSLYQPVRDKDGTLWFSTGRLTISGPKSNKDLIVLAVISWWMHPVLSALIRVELSEIFRTRKGSEDLFFLCFSREVCLKYLFTSSRFNLRRVNGVFSESNLQKTLNQYRISVKRFTEQPVRKLVRHKGYRDKGTLPKSDDKARKQELLREEAFRLEQIKIEEYRSNIELYLDVNRSWLESLESSLLSDDYYFNSKKGVVYYVDDYGFRTENSERRGTSQKSSAEERESGPSNLKLRIENKESEISSCLRPERT